MATDYPDWQSALADAVTDPGELCRLLDLPTSLAEDARQAPGFRLIVPRPFLARMRRSDPRDPLLLQVLPRKEETNSPPHFDRDPLGESSMSGSPSSLWKYPNRLLIVAVGSCAVHCRFCFRRHFPHHSSGSRPELWAEAIGRVEHEPTIHEVILSGGDPLMVADRHLDWLAQRIAQIPHVSRLRVHTRLPIVIPQRVTDELIGWLRGTRLATVVVVHVNHSAEIDPSVAAALERLIDAGVPVLSQSVLLRGVNDSVDALAALFERLVDLRVMPYYLHQLDRVAGAAHFEVSEEEGMALVRRLRARLPGYAVPRYVRETPEGDCKEVLA